MTIKNQSGQTLLEFAVCSSLALLTLVGAAKLLRSEWERARCAYFVFEKAHSRLTGSPEPSVPFPIQIIESPTDVVGVGQCPHGISPEKIRFQKLENAEW